MSEHSRLAPSSADIWVNCPGSVTLSEQFPELLENPAAPEGTAAHWVAYSMLSTHTPQVGEIAPNGIAVTQEMLDGALLYYNHAFKLVNPHGSMKTRVRSETRVYMPSIHPEMSGTPDAVIDISDLTGEIHILDFKFGHLEVSPTSYQLKGYLRGILDELKIDGHAEQYLRVYLHVVQPRCYTADGPIRTYATTAGDLRADWNLMRAAAHEALGPNPGFKVGEHCRYCKGRRACEALKRATADVMDKAEYAPPVELPADQLGLELFFARRSAELLKARITGLEEQAEANLRAGKSVEGWCMQSGRSKTIWAVPLDEVHAMGDMMGVELRVVDAPTPKQAEALFKKRGIDSAVIDAYSETKPGALNLVPASQSIAVKAFGAKNV